MRAALLLVLLSAPALAKVCPIDGLRRVSIPEAADCARFQAMFERATADLRELGLNPARLRSLRVTVRQEDEVDCGELGQTLGCQRGDHIAVTRMALSLLHEFFHVWRGPHESWPKSWHEADHRFRREVEPVYQTEADKQYEALVGGS